MTSFFANRRVLITGGLGFLGSNLAVRLVESGAKVTVIDNLNPLYGGNLFNIAEVADRIEVVVDDVRNLTILGQADRERRHHVHLAAQVSYIDSLAMPFEDLDLNAKATLGILECCRTVNPRLRILFSSSRMTYGRVEGELISETCPDEPAQPVRHPQADRREVPPDVLQGLRHSDHHSATDQPLRAAAADQAQQVLSRRLVRPPGDGRERDQDLRRRRATEGLRVRRRYSLGDAEMRRDTVAPLGR